MKKLIAVLAAGMLTLSAAGGTYASGFGKSSLNRSVQTNVEKPQKKTGQKHEEYLQEDTLIVKYSGKISHLYRAKDVSFKKDYSALGYSVIKFKKISAAREALAKLSKAGNVQSVSPGVKFKLSSVKTDPKVSKQYFNQLLNLPAAQKLAGKNKVSVAVIDTGLDKNHPELKNKIKSSYNAINPINAPKADFHGTHVAGIIAGEKNNGVGGYGVNPQSDIISIDVFNRDIFTSDYTVAEGILQAIKKKVKVINMSLGSYYSSPIMEAAVEKARKAGIVMVASAGNEGADFPLYPASYAGVISVGAVDKNKTLTEYSSYGVSTDLVAPGDNIYAPTYSLEKKSTFETLSGTSMAAPMVTGTVSLLLSKYPKLNASQVEYILKKTATDLGAKGFDAKYGYGMVNPVAALKFNKKDIPSLSIEAWNKETILKKAKTFSGTTYTAKRVFTKPLDQHWAKKAVKKGETYQINLKQSKYFDSKLYVNVYSKDGKKQKVQLIDDVKEGKTEGYYFTAPYDGTLAIGVKDNTGNYDVKGSKLSEYQLSVRKTSAKADESTQEKPIVIGSLPYNTKNKGMYLLGKNGDDDFYQITTGNKPEMIKLEMAAQPGSDVSIQVFAPSTDEEEEYMDNPDAEKGTEIEEGEGEFEGEDEIELIHEINNGGTGEAESDVLDADPNTTYTIQVSNRYESFGYDFSFILFSDSEEYEGSSSLIQGAVPQNADPYEFKVTKISMPADEDGIDNIYELIFEEENEDSYSDDFLIDLLDELAKPYKLTNKQTGYLQSRSDTDWYRFTATKTGVYTFDFGNANHMVEGYQVSNYQDPDTGEKLRYLNVIGYNLDLATYNLTKTMYLSLEKGKTYYLNVKMDDWNERYSEKPYTISTKFLAAPTDKYENNDDVSKIKKLPAMKFQGDFGKNFDEEVFYYQPKTSGAYTMTLDQSSPKTKGLPKNVKRPADSYILIYEDKNKNKRLDYNEQESMNVIPYGMGSQYLDKNKMYIIHIQSDFYYVPFSLIQYTFEMKLANHKDEDAGSVIKKNVPSKPLSLKNTSSGKWEKSGRMNIYNQKKADEDWYKINFTKNFEGQIHLQGGKELDGHIEVYQKGKRIASSDRYSQNDTEILPVKLKKGTYYIKVIDANGAASITPYTLKVKQTK
ncbi:S8 family peptidase [Pradoshia sp.]